ncbi:pyrroline-5-carboxylate reductase [Candidatus Avelusimicrobium alvi]|uniref:pyrroline-5-carboxylate reductase n=1 Tax=Candidatus Avelusimicrobium alvi TaxID=3416221 RepID=UPI003D0FBF39
MKLGFIGAGEMGGAIIRGLLKSGWPKEEILASVHSADSARKLASELGIDATTDNRRAAEHADVIFLAVKPGVVPQVLEEIKGAQLSAKPVVCMALGWTLEKLQAALPNWPVIRIMPNTPVALQSGVTLFAFSRETPAETRRAVTALFERLGKTEEVPEELFDAATAVSGSGPAFVYYFIDALASAAADKGLPQEDAVKLAVQTVIGAAKMVEDTGLSPAQLAQKVATPGGCTAAGLDVLMASELGAVLEQTVGATVAKAKEFAR